MKKQMIIKLLFFLLLTSSLVFGQDLRTQKIKNLQKEAARLENQIKIRTDSFNILKKEIKHLQNRESLAKFNITGDDLTMSVTLRMNGKIRKSNNPMSDIITYLNKGDTVKLTDYKEKYWIINKGPYFGYLSEIYIIDTEEIKIFKDEIESRNEEYRIEKARQELEKARQELEKIKHKENEYRQNILKKFGTEIGLKLLSSYYWIGMTDEMAKISLGEPRNVNRSVGSWGVHEQWIYNFAYLYFEDGILTSYQNSI